MATCVTLDRDVNEDGSPSSYVVVRCKYLPFERFKAFRAATEGCRYDRKRRAKLVPIDHVPALLRALREAEFAVEVAPALVRALQEHTAQQWLDLKSAQERAKRIDEEYRKIGKALYPFQRIGTGWLATRQGALLADDMGLGKTIQTITAIPAGVPVLVVAPAVGKGVWVREIALWRPQLRVSVLKGRDSFRWPEPGEVIVTNYDILPNIHAATCKETLPAEPCPGCKTEINAQGIRVKGRGHTAECDERDNLLEERPCPGCHKLLKLAHPQTVMIGDEGHNLKNPKARRTRRWRALKEAVWSKDGRSWVLTATPLLNHPAELWAVFMAAGIAEEAFGNWKNFVSLFKGRSLFYGGYEWGTPEAEVAERIRRVSLRRMKEEVLEELPEKTTRELVVDIDKKSLLACDKYLDEVGGIDEFIALIEKDGIKFETMSKVRAALAMAKTPAMLALLEDYEDAGEPLVVFSAHRFPIDLLKKRKGWRVITGDTKPEERTAIEDQFQTGELKGVGCTIKAGGVAITLTRSSNAIFVDREFTPALNNQAADRIRRIGQTRGCVYTNLVAAHPLDARLAEIVDKKQKLFEVTVDAARVKVATKDLDAEQEAAIKAAQEEVRCGRVARRFAESAAEKWAAENLHTLPATLNDRTLVTSLAEEVQLIGLSEAQWKLAIRICKRYPECGACPEEAA